VHLFSSSRADHLLLAVTLLVASLAHASPPARKRPVSNAQATRTPPLPPPPNAPDLVPVSNAAETPKLRPHLPNPPPPSGPFSDVIEVRTRIPAAIPSTPWQPTLAKGAFAGGVIAAIIAGGFAAHRERWVPVWAAPDLTYFYSGPYAAPETQRDEVKKQLDAYNLDTTGMIVGGAVAAVGIVGGGLGILFVDNHAAPNPQPSAKLLIGPSNVNVLVRF